MAPALFLFLMQAMAQGLRKEWARQQLPLPTFRYHPTTTANRGRLMGQPAPATTKGQQFDAPFTLFVDDGAFLFETRQAIQDGVPFLVKHFRRFGLLVHVGTTDENGVRKKSKTEAMYFPTHTPADTSDLVPASINFGDGNHVHYTDRFKYLGSRFIPLLNDDLDIELRLQQATAQVNCLSKFWNSSTDMETKRMIFLAIPVNTALYGCESWGLTERHKGKLTAFYHRSIRKIFNINMYQVKDFHIRNEQLRNLFSVDDILDKIKYRQFRFLGNLARKPDSSLPRRLLGAWVKNPRKVGRPSMRAAHSYVESLQEILGDEISTHGKFADWMPLAKDESSWRNLADAWLSRRRAYNKKYGTPFDSEPVLAYFE